MDILVELQNLKDNRLLRDDQEVEKFEKAIKNILKMKDGNNIPLLCQGFDDETENDEVMFGLIHAIERNFRTIIHPKEDSRGVDIE
ncbi:hypothetical protein CHH58_07975 [Terribacillus saccharophilus]|uniref:Imm30 family immunity protein n=1 Tax=Terribacillus saccharophilus TaxID=361277 RepID=UPI000BA4EA42|nr:Imm30 family immunity protein [Terribacillus saccharophilus]PAF37579.1 hypothetical protein CHH58_07975 [Terribacillus saccharophilus]